MNNFIGAINGFYNTNIKYSDTDSLYIERKHCDILDLTGCNLCQRKNDLESGFIFFGNNSGS